MEDKKVESEDNVVNLESTNNDTKLTSEEYEHYKKNHYRERVRLTYLYMTFAVCIFILFIASFQNPGIYKINDQTLSFINQAFNAIVLLMIPFFLGMLGSVSRILMSGLRVVENSMLVLSSAMMAMFSWVGIKSGVLMALVAPHIERQGVTSEMTSVASNDFYTMALVAILVGMFSSNLYIFINQKVENLTSTKPDGEK